VKARIQQFISAMGEAFWVLPGLIVLAGVIAAVVCLNLDRSGVVPDWMIEGAWVYNGGGTGARTLLGAVVSSTIGVAGTVFSITIAALTLAAGQMGPRLLRNFTRDRGNQVTLGAFLGTFAFALMVLRSVRTQAEGEFVPHLSLSISILMALGCVGMLVFFVGHMAGRINVDTVIELVSEDVQDEVRRLTTDEPQAAPPHEDFWREADFFSDSRRGYLQHLDYDGLADWAAEHRVAIRLLVRPGDYVFPGAPIGEVVPASEDARAAVLNATALGPTRVRSADLEFSVRQLVEVAVRALSPGINDPHTAMSVLDRLGAALCDVAGLNLPNGVLVRDGNTVLVVPSVDYDDLTDTMFNMIRQSAFRNPAVLICLIDVLGAVLTCESNPDRVRILQRHVGLVISDADRMSLNPADLGEVRAHHDSLSLKFHRYGAGRAR
jgi:uncharacterized membrane protein